MAIKLYKLKGPGGECILNEDQAKLKEGLKGWENLGLYDSNRENPVAKPVKKAEAEPEPAKEEPAVEPIEEEVEVDEEDVDDLISELKSIRSNAELADFIEANKIDVDPTEYDGFKAIKEAVAKKIGG